MTKIRAFLILATIIYEAYSQVIPEATIVTPAVATTVIDNSVSNALANAIQLLIVSNLIQNTMNANIAGPFNSIAALNSLCSLLPYNPVIEDNYPILEPVPVEPSGFNIDIAPIYGLDWNRIIQGAPNYPDFIPINPEAYNVPPFPFVEYPPLDPFNPYPTVTPVMAEVLFPASIPAQLKCNFAYGPNAIPCVNVNVEPLGYIESSPPFGYPPLGPGFLY